MMIDLKEMEYQLCVNLKKDMAFLVLQNYFFQSVLRYLKKYSQLQHFIDQYCTGSLHVYTDPANHYQM